MKCWQILHQNMTKTPIQGLWGSLAVAGAMTAGAAFISKSADLDRTERFLRSTLRATIFETLRNEHVLKGKPEEAKQGNMVHDIDVDLVEAMVSKALDFGKSRYGEQHSQLASYCIGNYAGWKSMHEVCQQKAPEQKAFIRVCAEECERWEKARRDAQIKMDKENAQKQAKANHAAAPRETAKQPHVMSREGHNKKPS